MDKISFGARALAVVIAAAAVLQLSACEMKKNRMERRKDLYDGMGKVINGPIREMQLIHRRIIPREGDAPVMFLDAQMRACYEADPIVEPIEGVQVPREEEGPALLSAEPVQLAAKSFREGLKPCKAAGKMPPEELSRCLLKCMGDWMTLVRSIEQLRRDASWVNATIESVTPPPKKDAGADDAGR